MRKTLLISSLCLLISGTVDAQVTCEIRVDAHPHATTKQRVDYCLTGSDTPEYDNPGLVFSGVTVYHPAEEPVAQKPVARKGYFNQDKMMVSRTFVATPQFPQFTNDTVNEREVWEKKQVVVEQPVQLIQTVQQTDGRAAIRKGTALSKVTETKAGIRARQSKPGRQLRATLAEETSFAQTDLSELTTQEVTSPADAYTYDTNDVQPYTPATPSAPEYVPATPEAQAYVSTEQADQLPPGQEEIPVGTVSYAPTR